ncbi:MAG: flavodoxin family protein, partial [bacterium]
IWLEISGDFRNPVWALMTKKFTIKGNLSYLKMLPKLLTKKIDVPRSPTFSDRWTQPENILVLVGNPRKKNGLTSFYLEPSLDGIKSSGAFIDQIHLYDKEIKPCLGCFHCWTKTPGLCVQKDDQRELLDKLDHADLIVYALPLYYHSVPGKVKNHLDRQIPRMHPFFEKAGRLTRHPRRAPRKQSLALFSISGFPEMKQFDALVATFEAYARHDNTSLIGKVLIPGAMELYYNPTHRSILLDKLARLRSAGEQVVRNGCVDKRTLRRIARIPNSLDQWRSGANLHWYKEMEEATNKR